MALEFYLHIPFCIKKCNYCDFLSFPAQPEIRERYCQALMEEMRQTAEHVSLSGQGVTSIFMGGGTPSVLEPKQIRALFSCLRKHFYIEEDAEISVEANPGTLSQEKLAAFRESGVNRLSIGLQSTDDSMLKKLGRIHTLAQFETNYEAARSAGFDNINIDLMSALPGQTIEDYLETLRIVTALNPEHISAYSLIIEEGTPFAEDPKVSDALPDETEDRKMYELTKEILSGRGYERYEISNYALPGKECRHNIGYWTGTPYLGFGLGASSFYDHARFSNEADIKKYMEAPYVPFYQRADYERQSVKQEMEDRMIFGLRMMNGVSKKEFQKEFGADMSDVYGAVIGRYADLGLLEECGGRVRLTDAGIDVSNRIFEEFILGE